MLYTVGYVFLDEATPRDEHFRTVDAETPEQAELITWTEGTLAGDRVSVTGVMTDSRDLATL